MATRSAIGYELPSGKIRAVYCHWDGYPEHQLPILTEHYNSLRKVQALIKPGGMSSLRTEQLWDSKYIQDPETGRGHYEPRREPQPLYYSEASSSRSEPPEDFDELNEAIQYWHDSSCEHLYLFSPENGWQHYAI